MYINYNLLKSHEAVLANALKDKAFREIWDANATRRDIASKIIGERIKRHLSQRELAQKAGVKQPSLARLESSLVRTDGYQPSLALMTKIARALDMKLEVRLTS